MGARRLSALDTSFLGVETPNAHMHIGWAAIFDPPEDAPRPGFDELRAHVEARLFRARRCRQKLLRVPFELNAPVWVDDPDFDLSNHVIQAESRSLSQVVDTCMSQRLPRDRPLWQIWISPRTDDGRMALVGKAHHCMVDGVAADRDRYVT